MARRRNNNGSTGTNGQSQEMNTNNLNPNETPEDPNNSSSPSFPAEGNAGLHTTVGLGTANAPYHMVTERESTEWFCEIFWKISVLVLLLIVSCMETLDKMKPLNSILQFNEVVWKDAQAWAKYNITFNDIKGVHGAKAELEEIVHYLRDPKQFTRLGVKLPKGVLLIGPPGTGKTMLARAVAAEANVPFFSSSGRKLEEIFVDLGPWRVRNLFSAAKEQSPCIIFIDALDSIGGTHNLKEPQHMRMTLNQLLIELDGLKQNEGIVVIAATNSAESLDTALVRPGRFDHHVVISDPDNEARQQILEVHMSKVSREGDVDLESIIRETPGFSKNHCLIMEVHMSKVPRGCDVDLEIIARQTLGFSGAELASLVNFAALRAASEGAKKVTMSHLEYAKRKIIMQTPQRSTIMSEESRKLSAFHESGHAIVAVHVDGAVPLHTATIALRGKSIGLITQLPGKDDMSMSQRQMLAWLDVSMGGHVAEELVFGEDEVTSGASSDFEQATSLAKAMVTKYGMSKEIGPVFMNYDNDAKTLSNDARILIENEMIRLLEKAYKNAKGILTSHKKELDALAHALLERETLTGSEIKASLSQVSSR